MKKLDGLIKINGHGPIGLAFLPPGNNQPPRNGFFVNHRVDGTPRLKFDLYVSRKGQSHCYQDAKETYPRRLSVEFALNAVDPFDRDTAVMISRNSWDDLSTRFSPADSPEWPTFDALRNGSSDTTTWRGESMPKTRMMLGRPTVIAEASTHGRKSPIGGFLGLWDSDEPCCEINRRWLDDDDARIGRLLVDAECSCFFPRYSWL
jgi:hypothetical protein